MSERPTPRTDALCEEIGYPCDEWKNHALKLERENAELREALEYALPDSADSSVIFDAEKLESLRAVLAATKGTE